MRTVKDLVADVAPKDALTYVELTHRIWPHFPRATRSHVNSTARACRRLADSGVVELWQKLEWRQRGRPGIYDEDEPGLAEYEEAARAKYQADLRARAHAGDIDAIRSLFTQDLDSVGEPGNTICWVAAVSRPLSELERKRLKRAHEDWMAKTKGWRMMADQEKALELRQKLNRLANLLNEFDAQQSEKYRAALRRDQTVVNQMIADNHVDEETIEQMLKVPDPFEAIGVHGHELEPREGSVRYLMHL